MARAALGKLWNGIETYTTHYLVDASETRGRSHDAVIEVVLQLYYSEDGKSCYLVPEAEAIYDAERQEVFCFSSILKPQDQDGDSGFVAGTQDQRGVIQSIYLLSAHNPLNVDFDLTLANCFDQEVMPFGPTNVAGSGNANNTKSSPNVQVLIPARLRGIVHRNNTLVYRLSPADEQFIRFAGHEQNICTRGSTTNVSSSDPASMGTEAPCELFQVAHPMVTFIAEQSNVLKPNETDVHQHTYVGARGDSGNVTVVAIRSTFLQKVRDHFTAVVKPALKYTRFTTPRLVLRLSTEKQQEIVTKHPMPKNARDVPTPLTARAAHIITLMFQVTYHVASRGITACPRLLKRKE